MEITSEISRNNNVFATGIYCIENLVNGKKYIGAAKNIYSRIKSHKSYLMRNIHYNWHLQNAWNKYGESNFKFIVILICKTKDLDMQEIRFIKLHKSNNNKYGYNVEGGGGAGKDVSLRTRKKISLAKKARGDWKGVNNPCYGKSFTGEKHPFQGKHHNKKTKDKISRAITRLFKDKTKTPMYGRFHSEETKNKIRKSREKYTGKNHPCYGKKHSKDSLKKMSESHRGKVASEETRRKMSLARKGRLFTEEHKKNLGISLKKSSLKGENHPRYGKKISEETREKMRVGRKMAWLRQKEE